MRVRVRPLLARRRRVAAAFVLLAALLGRTARRAEAEDPPPDRAGTPIERLRAMKQVDGSAVGESGDEGAFFALSKVLLEQKDETLWRSLLSERSPVVRAMGLTLLVRTKGKDALPDLRARLSDRERFLQFPSGCVGEWITVAEFARALARNRFHLDSGQELQPLVDAAGRLAVDLTILADDRMASAHRNVAHDLGSDADFSKLEFSMEGLRRRVPGLADVALVKAVARSARNDRVRAFLVACVGAERLAKEARLAAASALTLDVHPDAEAAIVRSRAALEEAAGRPVVEALLATIVARREHERRWAPVDAARTWMEHEAMADKIREALVADHPLALENLTSAFGLAVVKGTLRDALLASLVRIAEGLGSHAAAWDVYRDAPYRLEAVAVPAWGVPEDDDTLRPEEARRLLAIVRPHLDAR